MGIFGALTTSVTGMQAQSYALQNISGNIANSQTTGFKRTDTSFEDMILDGQPSKQVSGSVSASSRSTNTVQGDLQGSSIGTFMAVNGNGFFVVQKPTGVTDNTPQFSGVNSFTRRGDFQPDKDGYLVNGSGYYLMGIPIDPKTGNPAGSVPQIMQINNDFQQAQATTRIQYRANLAQDPKTSSGKEVLSQQTFSKNPVYGASTIAKITSSGSGLKPDAFASALGSISGLTTGATLDSLGMTAGNTLTIGSYTYTVVNPLTEHVSDIIAGINGAGLNLNASITSPDGKFSIVSTDDNGSFTIGGNSIASKLGVTTGQYSPTNLLTQGIDPGTQLTITVIHNGVSTPHTLTFGTGAYIHTLGALNTALTAMTGVSASVDTTTGAVTAIATSPGDELTITGGAATRFGFYTTHAYPADGTVATTDVDNFISQSLGGGAITTYDQSGKPINVQLRWAKVAEASGSTKDTWNLFYQSDTDGVWRTVQRDFVFDAKGQLTSATPTVQINGVNFDFGTDGITQYADTNGGVSVNLFQQNGYPAGKLQTVSVSEKGRLVGSFSNGRTVDLYAITLANFNGANYLKKLDGGAFAVTDESGTAIYNASGTVVGSTLEGSNTDIADEFTKLIVTQQAYSANTKVITTTNTMVQDLLNMLR